MVLAHISEILPESLAEAVGASDVPCLSPLSAWRSPAGIVFTPRDGYADRPLNLPCGKCIECRLTKKREIAVRAYCESRMAESSCFLTLTIDDDNMLPDLSVRKRSWQLFAKKLRNRVGPFRFLACGEYGDQTFRPHYHSCLFGIDFAFDRKRHVMRDGHQTYVSPTLEKLWPYGFHEIGDVTFDSAAYCASYAVKKVSKEFEDNDGNVVRRYERTDADTGETWDVEPEFAIWSRRPGLGLTWIKKYWSDVYPADEVLTVGGKSFRPPKYFDDFMEVNHPDILMEVKKNRIRVARSKDDSFKRRVARHVIKSQNIRRKNSV